MPRPSAKNHLTETAMRVFYQEGFHATGIERILEAAYLSKMTLYRHFKSKDYLILATIEEWDRRFNAWMADYIKTSSDDPRQRLLAIFDAIEEWFRGQAFPEEGFSGCMFINAASEYADPHSDINRAAQRHKETMVETLTDLARAAGAPWPRELGSRLALLVEGATVTAQVRRDSNAAREAKAIAEKLMDEALG